MQPNNRIYKITFASVYPLYIQKVERKGRTKTEVEQVICWLTGYSQDALHAQIAKQSTLETFFAEPPHMNPARTLITGVICGMRLEEIKEPIMRNIRYMDKLVDELAKNKPIEKILRK